MKANLRRQYDSKRKAEAILRAVKPDNLEAPKGIEVTAKVYRNTITVKVQCEKGLGSLLSTVDDVLSCIGAAERTLDALD